MNILHGTSSVSLQSTRYLADSLKKKGYNTEILIYRSNSLLKGYEDKNIDISIRKIWKYPVYALRIIKELNQSIKKYDVFHFHYGRTFLPYNLDLYILKKLRKTVFMEYHGSEIRRKSVFQKHNNNLEAFSGVSDDKSFKMQKRVAKSVNGVIVHDHELLENLYDFEVPIHILPLRINVHQFERISNNRNKRITIVHAPSKRKTKGTDYILSAIESLSMKYSIEFKLIEGVSNHEFKNILKMADIVIDQLIIGSYGMYSIESMAFGKPTICYLREDLIDSFPEKPPIYNANINNIKERLEILIQDEELRKIIGEQSRAYVEKYHNSDFVANEAIQIYENANPC